MRGLGDPCPKCGSSLKLDPTTNQTEDYNLVVNRESKPRTVTVTVLVPGVRCTNGECGWRGV